ncbi:hypothetical protein SAMN04488128_1011768 [Chitinophaga eiseniae]|uniref:Uncharacterized protein n=1 Tax=Chitinophaga eiseniae TaxID=634771 RepID=A0A1T4NV54_9BACT|nr:hypothetical protein SAMN04488128_1011768 [Chitinophaga eiseniae]
MYELFCTLLLRFSDALFILSRGDIRSHSGVSRQKRAPGRRLPLPLRYRGCAPSCHPFRAPSAYVRAAPGLAKGCFYNWWPLCPPSLRCPFCPPPARHPRPFIFDFAVRWRSRPDIGRRRGLLRLALAWPLRCASGPALWLPPQRPGVEGRRGRGDSNSI